MERIALTRVATFEPFQRFLETNGAEMERHMVAAGISPAVMRNPENLIPYQSVCNLLALVGRKIGIDDLGVQVGTLTPIREFGVFGAILGQSLTLHGVLEKLVQFIPLLDSGAHVWLENHDENSIRLCLRHDAVSGREVADAFALCTMIDSVRLALGAEWRPKKIWLDAASGQNLSNFEALAESEVERRVDYTAFTISRDHLACPVKRHRDSSNGANGLEGAYSQSAPTSDLAGTITLVLKGRLGTAQPTIQEVAEMAGLSVRTLQRRLATQGTAFGDLLDLVRYQEACGLLENGSTPLSEIAEFLGYSDPAHFTHAFRRWTGEPPARYRAGRRAIR